MSNSIYLGISAQLALQRRLDTIANNIANAGTAGFRAEQVRFTSKTSDQGSPDLQFSAIGDTYLVRSSGEVVKTGNPLDVAVEGDAWLAIATDRGTAYTRDGRLQISPSGELLTLTGHPVLDAGGTGIRLDPTGGSPSIARDGTITQNNRSVGTIGLFTIDENERIDRGVDASVIPQRPAIPAVDGSNVGLRQGFMERSNVNPVSEMSRLIIDQRMFEAVSTTVSETEQLRSDAIRSLGSN
ncbi:MAG: flagellar basal-body rod protein FlgF [Proteobacteria bacterium]|nr:flagellar basal-body rod protein FlgF [Pseudomonadota bacterium]